MKVQLSNTTLPLWTRTTLTKTFLCLRRQQTVPVDVQVVIMLMENFLFGSDLEDSFQEEEATKPPKKSERDARMNEKEEEVESDGAWSIFEIFCVPSPWLEIHHWHMKTHGSHSGWCLRWRICHKESSELLRLWTPDQNCQRNVWISASKKMATLPLKRSSSQPSTTLFVARQVWKWMVKRATSLFNLFCSNVARQVARFVLPVFPYLYKPLH